MIIQNFSGLASMTAVAEHDWHESANEVRKGEKKHGSEFEW